MAFTVKGFYDPENPTAYAFQADTFGLWAQGMGQTDPLGQVVIEGFDVTPGGAVRELAISAGRALIPGLYLESSATELVIAAEASSTQQRYVVLEANWSARTVTPRVVGSLPTLPQPERTPGAVWQMPLASVQVTSTTGVFATSAITSRKPLPYRAYPYRTDLVGTVDLNANTGALFDIITTTLPDPGWPYFLSSLSNADVRGDSGYIRVILTANGTQWADSRSIMVSEGARDGVAVIGTSPVMTGPVTVKMRAAIDGGVAGMGGSVRDNTNLRLIQHPAA